MKRIQVGAGTREEQDFAVAHVSRVERFNGGNVVHVHMAMERAPVALRGRHATEFLEQWDRATRERRGRPAGSGKGTRLKESSD